MTTVESQLPTGAHDPAVYDERLAEQTFLLTAQTEIQKLLNSKDLRYRDLAKRLSVSEARVSQMFGDEAANLTIRTIARIFHHLGEVPVLTTARELRSLSGGERAKDDAGTPHWSFKGARGGDLEAPEEIDFVAHLDVPRESHRSAPTSRDWALADIAA